jgi:hypothetical protein
LAHEKLAVSPRREQAILESSLSRLRSTTSLDLWGFIPLLTAPRNSGVRPCTARSLSLALTTRLERQAGPMSSSLPVAISRSQSTSTVTPSARLQPTPQAVPLQLEMSSALPQPRAVNPSSSNQPTPPVSLTATSPLSPSKLTRFVHLFNPPALTPTPGSSTEEGTRAFAQQGVTYSSLGGRRGSRSSGEQTYSSRARSGTLDSSGGIGQSLQLSRSTLMLSLLFGDHPTADLRFCITTSTGESPHSQGRFSWTASTPASSASALFAPSSMHRPSTELQSRARSTSLSRTHTNTSSSSSTSSSADYLQTPAQPAGQVYDPRIVREGERSPWSTGSSNEGRRGPAMVDPRFQFPMKRGSVGKAAGVGVGLGLGVTSAQLERSVPSPQAGSYVASLYDTSPQNYWSSC